MKKETVTVIDLGSSRIAGAAADMWPNGAFELFALDNRPSRGVTKGEITDMDKVVGDISAVVEKLGRARGKKIRDIYVTIKGQDIKIELSRGMSALSKVPHEITKKSVSRASDVAGMIKLPIERTVIAKAMKGFYVDGSRELIDNPMGLYAMKLEAEAFLVTTTHSKVQNIEKCVDHAGFMLKGIRLSSLASARSVLHVNEKEEGVIFLDIGKAQTEALIFNKGKLMSFRVMKKGTAFVERAAPDKQPEALKEFTDELFSLLSQQAGGASSIVAAGGGALLEGMIENIEKVFGITTRLGSVIDKGLGLNPQDALIQTPAVGLIKQLSDEKKAMGGQEGVFRHALRKAWDLYESYF